LFNRSLADVKGAVSITVYNKKAFTI